MNLYTPIKRLSEKSRNVNSHTVYLATLAKENPSVSVDLKLISTITHRDKKLYVLSSAGTFYLAPEFMLGTGLQNILYSSYNCARVLKYGQQYIKTL